MANQIRLLGGFSPAIQLLITTLFGVPLLLGKSVQHLINGLAT